MQIFASKGKTLIAGWLGGWFALRSIFRGASDWTTLVCCRMGCGELLSIIASRDGVDICFTSILPSKMTALDRCPCWRQLPHATVALDTQNMLLLGLCWRKPKGAIF
jgi:hypothetical protein